MTDITTKEGYITFLRERAMNQLYFIDEGYKEVLRSFLSTDVYISAKGTDSKVSDLIKNAENRKEYCAYVSTPYFKELIKKKMQEILLADYEEIK